MILISILDLRAWKPLSRQADHAVYTHKLPPEQIAIIEREFPLWLCELLKYKVKRAIALQQFPTKYKPLNKDYVEWKKAQGLKPGFWQATDFLRQSIKVWYDVSTATHHIGFPPSLLHPTDRTPVAAIAQRLEKGDRRQNLPPRPLFTPIAAEMSRNIRRLLREFLQRHHPTKMHLLDAHLVATLR